MHDEWGIARHDSADRIPVPRAVTSAEKKPRNEVKVELEVSGMKVCVKASICAFGRCSVNARMGLERDRLFVAACEEKSVRRCERGDHQ